MQGSLALGIDVGGTKIEIACVNEQGRILDRIRTATLATDGPEAVVNQIVIAARELCSRAVSRPTSVGLGIAGQIDQDSGTIVFTPNLRSDDRPAGVCRPQPRWRGFALREELSRALELPVYIDNDVRCATWGEWLHGSGEGCSDLVCVFVGTGIGGGVVSGGRMLSGSTSSAGEIGHITIDLNGPPCHCPNRGCLETYAGGWAIARNAQQAVARDLDAGKALLDAAGAEIESITAKIVGNAHLSGDPLASSIINRAADGLIAGAVSLVNAFNPSHLILGGGIIAGLPELIPRIEWSVKHRALGAATSSLVVTRASLHNDAGVVGAAAVSRWHIRNQENHGERYGT